MRRLPRPARVACVLLLGANVVTSAAAAGAQRLPAPDAVASHSITATSRGVAATAHASSGADRRPGASTHVPLESVRTIDGWLDGLWWLAFVATASAYVLVLATIGIRRLRAGQASAAAWAPLDVPIVVTHTRRVRPHL